MRFADTDNNRRTTVLEPNNICPITMQNVNQNCIEDVTHRNDNRTKSEKPTVNKKVCSTEVCHVFYYLFLFGMTPRGRHLDTCRYLCRLNERGKTYSAEKGKSFVGEKTSRDIVCPVKRKANTSLPMGVVWPG